MEGIDAFKLDEEGHSCYCGQYFSKSLQFAIDRTAQKNFHGSVETEFNITYIIRSGSLSKNTILDRYHLFVPLVQMSTSIRSPSLI